MADERFLEKQLQRSREKTMEKHSAKTADGGRCPHCGAAVGSSWEFCPACGGSLVPYCTFCGADIPAGEDECPECGMSRGGVKCPRCGARNVRAYCRKCNEPLTPAARKEVERAMKDPVFLKAAELAVKLAELEQQIQECDRPEDAAGKDTPAAPAKELPPDILRLKELLASVRTGGAGPARPAEPAKKAAPAKQAVKRKSKESSRRNTGR